MAQRYFRALHGTPASSEWSAAGRKLIAALWEDGRVFSADNLRSMRLLAPHLERALRLQMRMSSADIRAGIVSGALDCLTHGRAGECVVAFRRLIHGNRPHFVIELVGNDSDGRRRR